LVNCTCTLSPKRIAIGGGVMQQTQMFAMIRAELTELLNGYIERPVLLDGMESYIVPPQLGNRSGVLGALALAKRASESSLSRF
jgi:fructokinase